MPLPFRSTKQRSRQSRPRTDSEKRRGLYIGPNSEERRQIISFLHAGDDARTGGPNRGSHDTIKKARRRLVAVFLALLVFALWGLLGELL